jgi:hypothetical protein
MEKEKLIEKAIEEKQTFLKISRVPEPTRQLFIAIAEGEFSGDYGMLLKTILDQFIEYQRVKEVLLDKEFMTYILENKSQVEQKEVTETKVRKTFADVIKGRQEESQKEVKNE